MKHFLYILTILLSISCNNNPHVTVETLDRNEKNIIGLLERDINTDVWNIEIDSIRFFIKEYKKDGNNFIGEVYGTVFDSFDFTTLEYYTAKFISHFELWEEPIGKYNFYYEDVVYYIEITEEIKRYK